MPVGRTWGRRAGGWSPAGFCTAAAVVRAGGGTRVDDGADVDVDRTILPACALPSLAGVAQEVQQGRADLRLVEHHRGQLS